MADPRVSNLARVLVNYCVDVQPEHLVSIQGLPVAQPLLKEIYREVLRAGGYPYLIAGIDGVEELFLSEASDDQLQHVSKVSEMIANEFDARIVVLSSSNTRNLSSLNPERQQLWARTNTGIMETTMKRSAAKEMNWVGTLYPTPAYAQDAEMSLEEFEDFVYSTTYADQADPVAEWLSFRGMQQRLVDWLDGKKQVEVRGPHIEMSLSIEERIFWNSAGRKNMPSGEIFTGPVEDSANGWVQFSYPAVIQGREIEDVELHFEKGKVVKATAEKNEQFLQSVLEADDGARYLGEFAIGTNKNIDRFIKNILFDEKIGGTIHMALGAGYPETGSLNKSAIHMDMICDMRDGGQIHVDGELFYDSGEFKI
ncbi:MAG: aminopeptidase [Anaerolineales bacterium]